MKELRMLFGVDSGGSRTVAVVEFDDGHRELFELPSMSPVAVGGVAARATMGDLFTRLAALSSGAVVAGCIGAASVTANTLESICHALRLESEQAGLAGSFLLAEDATVLLLAPPLKGVGILSIVGTGSITIGRNDRGTVVQCGGYEYLVADEGSGYDLGVAGLRSAAQGYDGRGPATGLVDAARQHYGLELPAIGDMLAAMPFPKTQVARFAQLVCACAEQGDAVARTIVEEGARSVVVAVSTVWRRLGGTISNVVFSGSVVSGSRLYAANVLERLKLAAPGITSYVVDQPVMAALELARYFRGQGMPRAMAAFPCANVSIGRR